MWAIIGSSGFEHFDEFSVLEDLPRETPFGLCSDGLKKVSIAGVEALFLCRTGAQQQLLPSKINYRANIYVLKKYGATAILSLSSVRSLSTDYRPGDMVIPYQYIDRTKASRESTFCDNNIQGYVSLAHPICEKAANDLCLHKDNFNFHIHTDKTYICVEGPQFPTIADSMLYKRAGGAVIGMTAFPEYALAREAGLHYLPCNFVVDYIKWGSDAPICEGVIEVRHENYNRALEICEFIVKKLPGYGDTSRIEDSLAMSLNILPDMLHPDQKAWIDVVTSNKRLKKKLIRSDKSYSLYKGHKQLPKKLEDFLIFINKYKSSQEKLTIPSIRKNAEAVTYYSQNPVSIESIKDFSIKIDGRDIPLRLYHPNPSEKLPLLVYIHGGSFVSGSLNSFDIPCRALAKKLNRVLVAIDYRLAPEFPYPSGYKDVYDATKWIYTHANDLKASKEKFSIMGDSAGANYVALTVTELTKDENINISSQILLYPTVDLTHDYESFELFSQGYLLDAKQVNWCRDEYLPNTEEYRDPMISPLYAKNMEDLPPSFIITCAYDPLRDEGLVYAETLLKKGVNVTHYHFDNMIHAFLNFGKLVPDEIQTLYERVLAFLDKVEVENNRDK